MQTPVSTPSPAALLAFLTLPLAFAACDGDDDVSPVDEPSAEFDVPEAYTFDNVSYAGQQSRLAQLGEFKAYMGTAESGDALDPERLDAMFRNGDGAGYTQEYTKDLRSKTFAGVQGDFDAYLARFAAISGTDSAAAPGTPGLVTSPDGEKTYFVDANGVEWKQVVEKGLMGATLYYQATTVYLGADRMAADNEVVEPGEGTAMEHHWDEAFGYLGVPVDFPDNTDDVRFWGDYANDRDADLGVNARLMDNFLRGRAAISNGNLEIRDAAIDEIRDAWELVSAATAIHYLNGALDNPEDLARRLHALSEAAAFVYALQFNEASRLADGQPLDLLEALAGARDFAEMDLYAVTDADVVAVRSTLAEAFGLADQAAAL